MLSGLGYTLIIAVFSVLLGIFLGALLAVCKVIPQKNIIAKIFSGIANVYIGIFRGTPVMVQLLLFYFGIFSHARRGDPNKALIIAILVFGLNSAAYVCEIMRGGILSVDKGQMEAGRALGLNYVQTMIRIIIPQAIKNILPTLGNELITLVKETSVVSFVGATDLFMAFNYIGSKNYESMIPYLMMAVIYIVIIIILTVIIKLIERRLRASERH
jgi:polar amino acid transport system permease protein